MKYFGFLIIGLLFFSALSAQTPLTEAVDFTAKDVHGTQHHLFDILDNQQQYVMIDFFSVTCGPCQDMAPIMDTIYHYFGSNEQGLFMMAIDQSFDNDMVLAFEEEYNTHYPSISGIEGGGSAIYEDYQIPYYPSLILIAPNHEIVEQAIPIPETASEMVDLLESYGLMTIGVKEMSKNGSFEIFPIPAQDFIQIRHSQEKPIENIKIYTISGESILLEKKTAILNSSTAVDISFLEKGIYLLSFEDLSGERHTKTFIKN